MLPRALHTTRALAAPAPAALLALAALETDAHHALAATWLAGFAPADVPASSVSTSYARSSGPGGQHVNKTNSKAVVRVGLGWLPPFVLAPLSKSPHYLPSPPSLLVSSQTTRSASANAAAALARAHEAIAAAARSVVRGQTSEAQRARVRALARAERGRVRVDKERSKGKKASRRGDY